jgi:hypothetical protein
MLDWLLSLPAWVQTILVYLMCCVFCLIYFLWEIERGRGSMDDDE